MILVKIFADLYDIRASFFSFEDVKAEMDYLRGKRSSGGKVSIKKFIDGLMLEAER